MNEGSYKIFLELDRVSGEQLDQDGIIINYPEKSGKYAKTRISSKEYPSTAMKKLTLEINFKWSKFFNAASWLKVWLIYYIREKGDKS